MNTNVSTPVAAPPRKVGFLLGLGIFLLPIVFVWFLLRDGYSKRARIIGFVWLILVALGALNRKDESASHDSDAAATTESSAPSSKAPPSAPAPDITITATQLHAAYSANEVAADQQFKGRMLTTTGRVTEIDSSLGDSPVISLYAGDFDEVYAYDIPANVAATLRKGQSIALACKADGEIVGTPILRNCALATNRLGAATSQASPVTATGSKYPETTNPAGVDVASTQPKEASLDACLEQAGSSNTKMLGCTYSESEKQDDRLNAAYKTTMASITNKDSLREKQRKWIKERDEECADDGASGLEGRLIAANCVLEKTITRADELEALLK